MPRRLFALPALWMAAVLLSGCLTLERRDRPDAGGMVEPDVFDMIRASNSRAAVQYLRDRYLEELEHARILDAEIERMMSAEEGLAIQLRELESDMQDIQDEISSAEQKRNQRGEALRGTQQKAAELEAQAASENQRVGELTRQIESLRGSVSQLESELEQAREIARQLNDAEVESQRAELRGLIEQLESRLKKAQEAPTEDGEREGPEPGAGEAASKKATPPGGGDS